MLTENERRIISTLKRIITEVDMMATTPSPGKQLGHYSGSLKILIS